MESAGILKVNLREEKQGYANRMRLSMRKIMINGRKLKPSACSIVSKISTFSNSEKACLLTYNQMQEEFGYKHSTISRGIDELIKNGIIESVGRTKEGTAYRLSIELSGKYILIPQFLYTAQIYVDGNFRGMKGSEIVVLSYLMHVYKAKNTSEDMRKKWVQGWSIRELSRYLCYTEKTIVKAIHNLIKARLIYRPSDDKGKNGYKKSRYTVNSKLYEYERKRKAPKKKSLSKEIEVLNKKAEFESYYAKLREEAQNRADRYLLRANKNTEFREISKELKMIELSIAKAELYNPAYLVVYAEKKKKLEERRAELLCAMNINLSDLIPQYRCKKCSDTGFDLYGAYCGCYKKE